MTYRIFLSMMSFALICSCGDNDVDKARESLVGSWTVDQIYTEMGEQLQNGQTPTFDTLDIEATGSFDFEIDGTVDFSYNTLGTTVSLEDMWSLQKATVNCGFTNCDEYTISIGNEDYLCAFGDQTSDAHIDATAITLLITTVVDNSYVRREIALVK